MQKNKEWSTNLRWRLVIEQAGGWHAGISYQDTGEVPVDFFQ